MFIIRWIETTHPFNIVLLLLFILSLCFNYSQYVDNKKLTAEKIKVLILLLPTQNNEMPNFGTDKNKTYII